MTVAHCCAVSLAAKWRPSWRPSACRLSLSDLFPPRPITHAGPIPGYQRPRISDRDLLEIIRREVAIIATAGEELIAGPLSLPDLERLRTAVRRLFGVLVEARHG